MADSSLVLFMLLTVHWGAFVAAAAITNNGKKNEKNNGNMQSDMAQRQMRDPFQFDERWPLADTSQGEFMWPAFNSF